MADLKEMKAAARRDAFARRKIAHANGTDATDALLETIAACEGQVVSGYWPIRTEIDTRTALGELSRTRQIVLPVVEGAGKPLSFRFWAPGTELIEGAFGAAIPKEAEGGDPDILIVPLAAFDARGYRLGYGGGFYDRTLEKLRAKKPTLAIGFAFADQKVDDLPTEPTDQPLDAIVTENGAHWF